MSFVRRKIDVVFTLGTGAFGESGTNTVRLSGLRVHADITKAGGTSMGQAQLRIFGITPSKLNELSSLTRAIMLQRNNSVTVLAGDDVMGMSVIFVGTIAEAWADLNSPPDALLHVVSLAGLIQSLQPIPASSFPAQMDVATFMAGLATQMGLTFENNGVLLVLSTPYFPGTAFEQMRRCADAANINAIIDNGKLAIWNKGASRGGARALVSPETGMVGYPAHNGVGVSVTTIFNPTIGFGQLVDTQSSLVAACGTWFVYSLKYSLESETPGGEWFTYFQGAPLYNANVIPK